MFISAFSLILGVSLIAFAIFDQLRWLKRISTWIKTEGKIVEAIHGFDGYSNRIAFRHHGKRIEFTCPHIYQRRLPIGKQVTVLYDQNDGSAKLLNWRTRWSASLTCLFVGTLFTYGSWHG